jgi:hypothetical protein
MRGGARRNEGGEHSRETTSRAALAASSGRESKAIAGYDLGAVPRWQIMPRGRESAQNERDASSASIGDCGRATQAKEQAACQILQMREASLEAW